MTTSTGLRDRAGELLPCPFCNGTRGRPIEDETTDGFFRISCYGCNVHVLKLRRHEAVTVWNTRALLASPAPAGAEGWVLVPLEPTEEMLVAGAKAMAGPSPKGPRYCNGVPRIYAAMLDASPAQATPPAEARELVEFDPFPYGSQERVSTAVERAKKRLIVWQREHDANSPRTFHQREDISIIRDLVAALSPASAKTAEDRG